MTLFDMPPGELAPPAQGTRLSADRRRTLRNEQLLAAGVHPTTRRPLTGTGETCGTCPHVYANRCSKTYWKCGQVEHTGGPATDVRLKWPACELWSAPPRER